MKNQLIERIFNKFAKKLPFENLDFSSYRIVMLYSDDTNKDITTLNLTALGTTNLAPIPDITESYGLRNQEDEYVLALVMEDLRSGQSFSMDAPFFDGINAIISLH